MENGNKLKLSINLLKKLDTLRSEMDIIWRWVPRNSAPEMVLADALANLGCMCMVNFMQGRELTVNQIFRRTVNDRKMMYPDDLPPTVLECKEKVMIPPKQTVQISCGLDISKDLKNKLIKNKSYIMNMTSDQAYGFVTTLRTASLLKQESDYDVIANCHTHHQPLRL